MSTTRTKTTRAYSDEGEMSTPSDKKLDRIVSLLIAIGRQSKPSKIVQKLKEELTGFHQAIAALEQIIYGDHDLENYLKACSGLCEGLNLLNEWSSKEAQERIATTVHVVGICRMALLIEYHWRIL